MKKKVYILAFLFFLLDRVSKIFVLNLDKFPIKIINNFFYIEKEINKGAAFSILNGFIILFIIIAIFSLFYIHKYVFIEIKNKLDIVFVSLLIGGILGNLFDRIVYKGVIDFLSFKFGNYIFPVFNLADVFICIGIVFLIIKIFKGDKNGSKN